MAIARQQAAGGSRGGQLRCDQAFRACVGHDAGILPSFVKKAGFPPGVVNVVTGDYAYGTGIADERSCRSSISFTGSPGVAAASIAADAGKAACPRHARARRQVAEHHFRRRRVGQGDRRCARGHLRRDRPDMHCGLTLAGAASVCTTMSPSESSSAPRRSSSAIRSTRPPRWALPRMSRNSTASCQAIDNAKSEGATLVDRRQRRGRRASEQGTFHRADHFHRTSTTAWRSRRRKCSVRCCRSSRSTPRTKRSRIGNDTKYGLASGVWTTNLSRALRVSREIHAGMVWVNTYRAASVHGAVRRMSRTLASVGSAG